MLSFSDPSPANDTGRAICSLLFDLFELSCLGLFVAAVAALAQAGGA